jgi:hypothetical protein
LRVQATKRRARFDVTADGEGLVGHAGAALLVELADRLGLPAALDRWTGRERPGQVRHTGSATCWPIWQSSWPMVGTA